VVGAVSEVFSEAGQGANKNHKAGRSEGQGEGTRDPGR